MQYHHHQQQHLPPPPAAIVGTPTVRTHNEACPMAYDHLLHTIAVLEHTAYDNAHVDDQLLQGTPGRGLTPFHSSTVPPTRLAQYVNALVQRTAYGRFGVAAGIALVARYLVASGTDLTPLVIHRLFALCIQVGMKTNADYFVKNSYFAGVAGFSLAEFNRLEAELLDVLEYRAMPSKREFWSMPQAINMAYGNTMAAAAADDHQQEAAVHVAPAIMQVVYHYAFAGSVAASPVAAQLRQGSFPSTVAHSVPLAPEELVTPTAGHVAPLAFAAHGGAPTRTTVVPAAAASAAAPLSGTEPSLEPTVATGGDDDDDDVVLSAAPDGTFEETPAGDSLRRPRRQSELYVSDSGVSPPYALRAEDGAAPDDLQTAASLTPTSQSCTSSTFPSDEAAGDVPQLAVST